MQYHAQLKLLFNLKERDRGRGPQHILIRIRPGMFLKVFIQLLTGILNYRINITFPPGMRLNQQLLVYSA
jgi:hypothetical protein